MPYRFTLKLFNPYNFGCPSCGTRLRAKKSTLYLSGCALLGAVLGGIAGWSHCIGCWTITEAVLFLVFVGLVAALIWQYYIYRTDTLIERHVA
ncbi:MAG: hypothetical protein WDM76_16020 [Limisphaerales bacterium]